MDNLELATSMYVFWTKYEKLIRAGIGKSYAS